MRIALALNPLSRRGAHYSEAVRAELEGLGVEIVDDASSHQIDAMVVGGGDGTLVRQIPRALAARLPVGIVPLGTFNDLARTLHIPLDPLAACAVIAAGRTRAIDVARVNGVYYVTEASIGLSSRIARRQRPEDKQRFGFVAILASLLSVMRYARPFHAEVAFDGHRTRLRAMQLTIANSQRFGGFISVEDASIDDGRLECYSVEIENIAEFFSVAAAVLRGRYRSSRGLRSFRATAFDVWTRHRHHIRADGEPAGETPARFEVLPAALNVFAP